MSAFYLCEGGTKGSHITTIWPKGFKIVFGCQRTHEPCYLHLSEPLINLDSIYANNLSQDFVEELRYKEKVKEWFRLLPKLRSWIIIPTSDSISPLLWTRKAKVIINFCTGNLQDANENFVRQVLKHGGSRNIRFRCRF